MPMMSGPSGHEQNPHHEQNPRQEKASRRHQRGASGGMVPTQWGIGLGHERFWKITG